MYTFGQRAIERIRDAVKRVEAMPRDVRADSRAAYPPGESFWAYLEGCNAGGTIYSWVRVFPAVEGVEDADLISVGESGLRWNIAQPPDAGSHAVEANGSRGLLRYVVKLSLAGYRDGEPVFVFEATPQQRQQGVPIHDHRDNYNGGFAFSVFHPGTNLPQQPWSI